MRKPRKTIRYPYTLEGQPLTEVETAIIEAIIQGYSFIRISKTLNITKSQMKWLVKKLYCKLGVNTKIAAVTKAIKTGIVD